jgi:hypothetical protein
VAPGSRPLSFITELACLPRALDSGNSFGRKRTAIKAQVTVEYTLPKWLSWIWFKSAINEVHRVKLDDDDESRTSQHG